MDNHEERLERIEEALGDLRIENIAQGTMIHLLLKFIEFTHGKEARDAISTGLNSSITNHEDLEMDDDQRRVIKKLSEKYREFI